MKKGLSSLKTFTEPKEGDKKTKKEAPINSKDMQAWNDWIVWLDKKGLKGNKSLDTGDMGNKMIDEYRKENPNTSLTRDMVIPIQKAFKQYRDFSINELRNKKAMLVDAKNPNGRFVSPDENLDSYMKDLSIVDGLPGSKTSSHKFPLRYMKTYENGALKSVENQGFAVNK